MTGNKKQGHCRALVVVIGLFLICPIGVGADSNSEKHRSDKNQKRNQGKPGVRLSDPVSHILNFEKELGLSGEQYSGIKAARLSFKKEEISLTANIKIARLDLQNLLHSGSFDEKMIFKKSGELEKLAARKIRLDSETLVKVFKILKPEQIKKVKELRFKSRRGFGAGFQEGS